MRFASLTLSFLALTAWAAPVQLPYQGRLDKAGKPLSGSYDLTFTLFDAPAGGNQLWTDTFAQVPVVGGAFSVKLGGNATLDSMLVKGSVYVAIAVQGPGETAFTALAGRQQLLSAPHAIFANGSEHDFVVGDTLKVGAGTSDGGTVFMVGGDGGTSTFTLRTVGPGTISSGGTLSLQPQGNTASFGGAVTVANNLVVTGSVSGNNIGTKIYDGVATLGSISIPLDTSKAQLWRIQIDGTINQNASAAYLYLKLPNQSTYRSQLLSWGDWAGYINDTAGFILAWNPDNGHDTFNTTLTVSANSDFVSCFALNVAGSFNITDPGSSRYFFGQTGGVSCIPGGTTSLTLTSNANSTYVVHVVAYQLPN